MVSLCVGDVHANASRDDMPTELRRRVIEDDDVDVILVKRGYEGAAEVDSRLRACGAGRKHRAIEKHVDVHIVFAMGAPFGATAEQICGLDAAIPLLEAGA